MCHAHLLGHPNLQVAPLHRLSILMGRLQADHFRWIMVVWGRGVKKLYLGEVNSHRATKPQGGKGVLLSELRRGFVPSCEAGCVFLFACGDAETLSSRGCRSYLPANRLWVSVPARVRIPLPLRVSCAVCGLAFASLSSLPFFLYPFPFYLSVSVDSVAPW